MRVRFGDFVLDRATRQLLKDGEVRPLEPKAYELLDLLHPPAAGRGLQAGDPGRALARHLRLGVPPQLAGRARASRPRDRGRGVRLPPHRSRVRLRIRRRTRPRKSPAAPAERAGAQVEWERGVVPLMEGENLIGRGEEMAVRIDVDGVSRRHARIVAARRALHARGPREQERHVPPRTAARRARRARGRRRLRDSAGRSSSSRVRRDAGRQRPKAERHPRARRRNALPEVLDHHQVDACPPSASM